MRSYRFERAIALAPILLTALVCSGCPELNTQPDYLGEKNSLMSVPDPLPAVDPLAPYKSPDGNAAIDPPDPHPGPDAPAPYKALNGNAVIYVPDQLPVPDALAPGTLGDSIRPKASLFDHGNISLCEEGGLSDQARRAQ